VTAQAGDAAETASGAAQRGDKVIVPLDCSAGKSVYHEQYAAFRLAKGGPANIMLTRSAMVKF
jgi:hypothetical protein